MNDFTRFHAKYVPEPNTGCWLWEGATIRSGYGRHNINGVQMGAHRASWIIHNGDIPDGMHVCHKCDTPPCVNPDHLFLGTHADNMRDMQAKERGLFKKDHFYLKPELLWHKAWGMSNCGRIAWLALAIVSSEDGTTGVHSSRIGSLASLSPEDAAYALDEMERLELIRMDEDGMVAVLSAQQFKRSGDPNSPGAIRQRRYRERKCAKKNQVSQ